MQMYLHFYPAIVSLLSLYCYKRDNSWMQKFYRRMTFSLSARKLFVLMLMLLMLVFNFCYLQSFGLNLALGLASLLCVSMFSFRMSEKSIFWLQGRIGIGLTFAAMLTCVIKPQMWPLTMNLYIFTIGSIFYPSSNLMRQLKSPESFSKFASNPETLLTGYYSR